MHNDLKKYKRQFTIYFVAILAMVVLIFLIMLNNYSFSALPISFTFLILVLLALLYLIYKTAMGIINFTLFNFDKNDTKSEPSEINQKTSIISEEDRNKRYKDLLSGITKKTSKKGISEKFLKNIINNQQADIGLFYIYNKKSKKFELSATYAYLAENKPTDFKEGEGINGQAVKNKKAMLITDMPDDYLSIISGLGKGKPKNLFIFPIVIGQNVAGVVELASFRAFDDNLEEELTNFFKVNSDKFINIDDN